MPLPRIVLAAALAVAAPAMTPAPSAAETQTPLHLELNKLRDVGQACRLTFVAQNGTGAAIDQAVFETVVFDTAGGVISLSLFDFRALPVDRMRVREFDLPDIPCNSVGRVLINGSNTCVVGGVESGRCDAGLTVGSRIEVELLG